MKYLMSLICVLLLGSICLSAEYYVAPGGKDSNPGSKESPFATIERAKKAIRADKLWKDKACEEATVYLRDGYYSVKETLKLEKMDSGKEKAPVIYRSYAGEKAVLTGGRQIPVSNFKPVQDKEILQQIPEEAHGNVMMVNLKSLGIDDFGEMIERGFSQPIKPATLELVFNNEVMPVASWPNEGYARFVKVIDSGTATRNEHWDVAPAEQQFGAYKGGTFVYEGDRPEKWMEAKDVWLLGFWMFQWADELIKVKQIDTAAKQITLATPHTYGLKIFSKNGYGYYKAMNLLQELDMPGEWFLDRDSGVLYFWPPDELEGARIVATMHEEPIVIMDEVSNITFRGITFEDSRGMGIYMVGGENNLIAGCTFRNFGTLAVHIGEGEEGKEIGFSPWYAGAKLYADTAWNSNGGTNNGILSCDIYNTGAFGIVLAGGDKKTLTPAANFAINNHIHHFQRIYLTNVPGIEVEGVGNIVRHNLIHDAPHDAIMYWGNEHLFEYNKIHNVCLIGDDAGAIYTGRQPTGQGNVIRWNYFADIGPQGKGEFPSHVGTASIYFDDYSLGQEVYGNVMYRGGTKAAHATTILVNGGYAHKFYNNILIDCPEKIISPGVWSKERRAKHVKETVHFLRRTKHTFDITKPPYANRYPSLNDLFEVEGTTPRVNHVYNNFITTRNDECFENPDELNFKLKAGCRVFNEIPGFKPIPFEKIGLYKDEYRTELPEKKCQ